MDVCLYKWMTNTVWHQDKAAQQQALEKVHKYEEAFSRIQQATGICSVTMFTTDTTHPFYYWYL
jgi:transposase